MWKNVTYEEEIMNMFSWSMRKHAKKWYLILPPMLLSSFHQSLMILKEAWVDDGDKDLVANYVDVML